MSSAAVRRMSKRELDAAVPSAGLRRWLRRKQRESQLRAGTDGGSVPAKNSKLSKGITGKRYKMTGNVRSAAGGGPPSSPGAHGAGSGDDKAGHGHADELGKRDPITLEPLEDDCFVCVRPGGSRVAFNVEPLVRYMLKSGQFVDPTTRVPFSGTELEELDKLAVVRGMEVRSLSQASCDAEYYEGRKCQRDQVTGLDRVAGDSVHRMRILIQSGHLPVDEIQANLLTVHFPDVAESLQQYATVDVIEALAAVRSFIAVLQGPGECPQPSSRGFRDACVRFLRSLGRQIEAYRPADDEMDDLAPARGVAEVYLDVMAAADDACLDLVY